MDKTLKEGDPCPHPIQSQEALRLGQIFQARTKYLRVDEYKDENGEDQTYWMGCYGVGRYKNPCRLLGAESR